MQCPDTVHRDESPRGNQQQPDSEQVSSHSPEDRRPADDPADGHPKWVRRIVVVLAVLVGIGLAGYYGVPMVERYLNTVSTDDAYVHGHVTYVGPRIASRVETVLVEEADFISAGQPLLRLDAEPFRLAVETAEAELQVAQASLNQAEAVTRASLAQVRSNRYLVQSAIDDTQVQVSSLRAAVATLELDKAKLDLAERDFARVARLTQLNAQTQEDYDRSLAALKVARDQVAAQEQTVQESRAQLGLARNMEKPVEVPGDIERRNSAFQVALSNWATSLLKLGLRPEKVGLSADTMLKNLNQWLPDRLPDQTLAEIMENAPEVQLARAKVRQAQAALDKAKLDLSYTEIEAPFDGFVTRRTVNPGDYVTPGQDLLAVQSLRDVWIEANFKETQIDDLTIGLPVYIYVDAYPGRMLKGRVVGFSPATGSRLSLLPPENATGNFVKVVQRLPVRIELDEPPTAQTPLFVGLSVEPYVRFKEAAHGPHAGERLRVPSPSSDDRRPPGNTSANVPAARRHDVNAASKTYAPTAGGAGGDSHQ